MGGMQTTMLGGDRKEPPCSVQGASACPNASTSPPARRFTNPPCGLSRRFHYTGHDRMDHWPFITDSLSSSPLPGDQGMGLEVPALSSSGWVPWPLAPSLGTFQKSPQHELTCGSKVWVKTPLSPS